MNQLNKVRAMRSGLGFTQAEVAEYLGCKKQAYMNKELGRTNFTQPEVNRLIEMFKCDYKDIFAPTSTTNGAEI